ncbi:MAG: 30S ribosome-binding factor RbfA [Gammaproteobacteria bacterium]|nr:30S ribosome-binding factor RbfA [Gammaproteobacteria bacterium]
MAGSERTRKIGEQIQQTLAQVLQREVKDPRVAWVTISAVHLTRDLQNAKVFYTVLNDDADARKDAHKTLGNISGFLRHELGQRLKLRALPQLVFVYDESIERGNRLARLIDSAVATERKDDPQQD